MKMLDELKHMCEILEEELSNVNKKVDKSGGTLSGDDISYIDKLTHSIKSIKTTIAMMEADDGGSYADGMQGGSYGMYPHWNYGGPYARGRNAKRDSMGRYSRNGYSRDSEMVSELKEMMETAPDERTRQEFQRFITKIESM
jgi:hypothetical protein